MKKRAGSLLLTFVMLLSLLVLPTQAVSQSDISLKGDVANGGESMEFNATSLNYYKAGSATPITVDFAVADSLLSIDALGLKMRGYVVSDNCVILVEEGGTLWELTR